MFETTHQKAWMKLAYYLGSAIGMAFRVVLGLALVAIVVAVVGILIYGVVWIARLAWR